MADVEFTITRTGFDTIVLKSDGGGPYGFRAQTQGLGMGPVISRFREGPTDGGTYEGERVGIKAMDLGIIFLGDGRLDTGTLIRNFRNLIRAREGKPHAKLVASYADGTVLSMSILYSSGLEIDYTQVLPDVYRAVVAVDCPNPYWTAKSAVQFSYESDASATAFLDDLSDLPVASSNIVGDTTITNPGDVPANLTVVLTGPTTGESSFAVNGQGWVFETLLSAGEVITVARTPQGVSVTDQTGANRYGDLATAPKFPQLPAGDSVVSVTMVGATAAIPAAGFFQPGYEGLY